MSVSEVAQLRQRIDQEIAAAKSAMTGYAQVSSHEIITHHFATLGDYMERLQVHVGPQEAIQIIAEALEKQL